jgi:hypothetical protein
MNRNTNVSTLMPQDLPKLRGFLQFIGGVGMSFLPPRYRPGQRLKFETMTGAMVQGLGTMTFLVYRFMIFSWQRAGIIGSPVDTPSNMPEVNANYGTGVFALAEFVMQPLNMLLLYLFYEAVVRFVGAWVSDQVLGSLPLYLVSWVHGLIDKGAYQRYIGARILDEVIRTHDGLVVRSSRPKVHWNPYMTIEYDDEFYQMVKEDLGEKPRRFVYHLKKNPVGRIVVTIDHYKADDVLKPPPRDATALQQMGEDMISKVKQQRQAPLVEDLLVRGGARQGYDLKIYSCRPKPDWNSYVAIEFEDVLYELFKQECASRPREFVFFLRKAPMNKPAVVVRRYRVDEVLK